MRKFPGRKKYTGPVGKILDQPPVFIMPKDNATLQRLVQPEFEIIHRFGGCSLVRYRIVAGGALSYLCTFKGKRADRLTAREALRSVREQVKKPPKVWVQTQEIICYRGWKLRGDNLVPLGYSNMTDYDAGPILKADKLPTMENTNGIWGVKTLDFLKDVIGAYSPDVVGEIGMFGRVVEHTHGYRAEKIIILRLFTLFPASPFLVNALSQRYDCEVTSGMESMK